MLAFFCATHSRADLDNVPGILIGDYSRGNGFELRVDHRIYPDGHFLLRLIAGEIAIPARAGLWMLWILQPFLEGQGSKLFRRFARARIAGAILLGPWTARRLAELAPALADRWLRPRLIDAQGADAGPMPGGKLMAGCLAGQDLERLATANYDPSDAISASDGTVGEDKIYLAPEMP